MVRRALLSILETVLEMNNAALLRDPGGYQIIPLAGAQRQGVRARVGRGGLSRAGFRLQVVPLEYVGADAMQRVISPFVPEGTGIEVDEARNLIMVAGSANAIAEVIQLVDLFDVDWLKGMSFGLFPLERADVNELIEDLNAILDSDGKGLLKGMVRLVPIERLNAVLVITKRAEFLDRLRGLIVQFDQGGGGAGRSLYVYHLIHGDASHIATLLDNLFGAEGAQLSLPDNRLAKVSKASQKTGAGAKRNLNSVTDKNAPQGDTTQILADEDNNALLILATPSKYRAVEAAIRKLDIPRRQVLVEATIAEVTLSDNLQYGLQWFMKGTQNDYASSTLFSSGSSATLPGSVVPGFSYSLTDASGDVRFLFDMLANESKLKILSSPQVMVIDNETANIRVGDQIPIVTRSTSSVSDATAPVVNEIQFRDTGVLLQVTPHINSGGMVTMDISQEVSEPSADEFAAGNVSILQRSIKSSVAVQSGETVVLGGLIRENKTDTVSGVPFLSRIPVIGNLFSRTVDTKSRTELVVTITPKVIDDSSMARAASRELVKRMNNLKLLNKELIPTAMMNDESKRLER